MNIVISIAVIILLIVLIILFFKNKVLFKIIGIIFCLGLVAVSGYCLMEVNAYYQARGGIAGSILEDFRTNNVAVEEMNFKFTNMEFKQVEGNLYSAKTETNKILKLESDKTYSLFVNDVACTNVKYGENYITAEYKYNFYDKSQTVTLTDTLKFYFAFYPNYSSLEIETNGGSDAVKKWNYYFNKNNFAVSIKAVSKEQMPTELEHGTGIVPEVCVVTFDVDGVESKSIVSKGTKVQGLYRPEKQYHKFLGWSLDNTSILNNAYIIQEDITLKAMFEELYEWVNVYRSTEAWGFGGIASGEIDTYYFQSEFTADDELCDTQFAKARVKCSWIRLLASQGGFYIVNSEGQIVKGTSSETIFEFWIEEGETYEIEYDSTEGPGKIKFTFLGIEFYERDYGTGVDRSDPKMKMKFECTDNKYDELFSMSVRSLEIYKLKT